MLLHFHWASQTPLRNSRYSQPYGTRPCYKMCVLVHSATHCTHSARGNGSLFGCVCRKVEGTPKVTHVVAVMPPPASRKRAPQAQHSHAHEHHTTHRHNTATHTNTTQPTGTTQPRTALGLQALVHHEQLLRAEGGGGRADGGAGNPRPGLHLHLQGGARGRHPAHKEVVGRQGGHDLGQVPGASHTGHTTHAHTHTRIHRDSKECMVTCRGEGGLKA
jgi:hypothetical protein